MEASDRARDDITVLVHRYAELLDGGDVEGVVAMFSRATWRDMGGTGNPARAPEAEQDRIAAKLLARAGTSPWPNCG